MPFGKFSLLHWYTRRSSLCNSLTVPLIFVRFMAKTIFFMHFRNKDHFYRLNRCDFGKVDLSHVRPWYIINSICRQFQFSDYILKQSACPSSHSLPVQGLAESTCRWIRFSLFHLSHISVATRSSVTSCSSWVRICYGNSFGSLASRTLFSALA